MFPGRTDPSASRPAGLCSAPPPRRAPPRPDPPVVCPGFRFNSFGGPISSICVQSWKLYYVQTCRIQNPDEPRATRVRAAHDRAARRRGAWQDGTPTDLFAQDTTALVPSNASCKPVCNDSSDARTSEILCKPMGAQNQRLITVLPAGRRPLFVPDCWPMDRRLFVSVKPFHARHIHQYNVVRVLFYFSRTCMKRIYRDK